MSVRQKTFVVVLVMAGVLAVTTYCLFETVLSRESAANEQRETRENTERAVDALMRDIAELESTTADYSSWDDTCAFVESGDESFVNDNMMDTTFKTNRLSLVVILDVSGKIVFAKAYDLEQEKEVPLPPGLEENLAPGSPLATHTAPESRASGVLVLPSQILLVASRPILTSNGEGPVRGTVVMGRILGPQLVSEFSDITRLSWAIHRVDDPSFETTPTGRAATMLSASQPMVAAILDENRACGLALIKDVYGRPGLVLEAAFSREFHRQYLHDRMFLHLATLCRGTIILIVLLIILDRLVLRRLKKLGSFVQSVTTSGDLSARISFRGGDELSVLANSVNDMLDMVERDKSLRHQAEVRFASIVENAKDVIFVKDTQRRYTLANPAMCELIGLKESEIVHRMDRDVFGHDVDRGFAIADTRVLQGETVEEDIFLEVRGEQRSFHSIKVPLWEPSGAITGLCGIVRDTTERRLAEEALARSESLYRALYENAQDGILLGKDGFVAECNPQALEIFRCTREMIIGKSIGELSPDRQPDGRPSEKIIQEKVDAALDGKPQFFEWLHKRFDGDMFWTEVSINCVGVLGEHYVQAIVRDISARKHAEQALRESERWCRALLEYGHDTITVIDREGIIRYQSPSIERVFGYAQGEMVGRNAFEFVHPDDRPRVLKAFEEGIQISRFTDRIDYRFLHKDGSWRMLEAIGSNFLDEPGVRGVVVNSRDVTEHREAEEAQLRHSVALDQAAEGVMITDVDGRIEYVNPAFTQMTGYSSEEAVGRSPSILKSGKHDRAFYDNLWKTIRGGEVWSGQLCNKRKNGKFYEEKCTISPVRNETGEIINFVAIKRDVTHEFELERKLRQAQKMEAIGTLAGGIAHDFNNILQALLGYADLAQHEVPPESRAYQYLVEVQTAGNRARELVSQILAFSRRSEQERKPIRVQSIVKEAIKLLRGSIPSTIEIVERVNGGCRPVLADPTQIHQVIMNLCTNAYHAMRESGGLLEVSVDETEVGVIRPAELSDIEPGTYVRLQVRDSGHGMDSETAKRVFEPYFTTKEVGDGTGLGLSTVYGIATSHDGTVTVESSPGQGATFTVYLPLCPSLPATVEAKTEPDSLVMGSEHVLFVDDERAVVELGTMALQQLGYRVTPCVNSLEALEVFRANARGFDVVVTDQTMPKMTGIRMAQEMLRVRPDTPIVLCTGYSEFVDDERAKQAGIREFVMKPILPRALAGAIRRAVGNKEAL